jgi:PKD repeat protein
LNASGSYDPDNDPLTYNWSIVSRPEGSTSELDDPTSPTPKIFADRVGEYVFRLVVYDGELYSNPDTVIITSIIPNQNPIANPGGPYAGFIGVPVHFNGSGSYDPDGDPITFNWDFGDGASGSGVTPVHTYSSTGLYIVTLTVQDSKGGSGSAQTTAQINNPMPLLLSINPASIAAGSPDFTLTLNGDNFITTSTVIFNNQQYSSNYINKTQIEATIPASAVATPGDYLAKVINPSPGGGETSPLTFTVKPAFEIAITSPSDGETINKAKIIVRGTVKSDTKDLGITVNGLIAEISGNNWVASNIPLTSGTNLIKAVAKDSNGNTATKTITIYTNEITQFLELSANVRSGIPPLEVYFSVSTSGFTPVSFQMDFEGDGIIDYNGTTFDNISYTYTNEGMFYPKVMVSDNQGNTYSDTIVITVLSKTELDDLLKGKWEGMKQSLLSNDINGALNHFIEESKELYNDIFNALQTQLPQIIQEMQDIQLMYAKSGVAKYRIRKNELCGGQLFNITYYIYFIVDRDGIWRIYKF